MCQASDPAAGRTHPVPRKPSNRSASDDPARTHATIWAAFSGATWRTMETVTAPLVTPDGSLTASGPR